MGSLAAWVVETTCDAITHSTAKSYCKLVVYGVVPFLDARQAQLTIPSKNEFECECECISVSLSLSRSLSACGVCLQRVWRVSPSLYEYFSTLSEERLQKERRGGCAKANSPDLSVVFEKKGRGGTARVGGWEIEHSHCVECGREFGVFPSASPKCAMAIWHLQRGRSSSGEREARGRVFEGERSAVSSTS